ncbi:MAG: fasciclin domain-containing protein [Gemmatimonadota bacterium]
MKTPFKALTLVFAIALSAAACNDDATGPNTEPSFVKGGNAQNSLPTIVDIVVTDDGEFDALQTVVVRSGLADVLSGDRPFTVFAPTDAAFGDLFDALGVPGATPEEQADNACPVATGCPDFVVTTVLYHVVNGRRYANSVLGASQLRTQIGDYLYPNGASLETSCPNSANIITDTPGGTYDILASNGVIHVIDAVLLPSEVCEAL